MDDDEHGPPKTSGNKERLNSHWQDGEFSTLSSRLFIPVSKEGVANDCLRSYICLAFFPMVNGNSITPWDLNVQHPLHWQPASYPQSQLFFYHLSSNTSWVCFLHFPLSFWLMSIIGKAFQMPCMNPCSETMTMTMTAPSLLSPHIPTNVHVLEISIAGRVVITALGQWEEVLRLVHPALWQTVQTVVGNRPMVLPHNHVLPATMSASGLAAATPSVSALDIPISITAWSIISILTMFIKVKTFSTCLGKRIPPTDVRRRSRRALMILVRITIMVMMFEPGHAKAGTSRGLWTSTGTCSSSESDRTDRRHQSKHRRHHSPSCSKWPPLCHFWGRDTTMTKARERSEINLPLRSAVRNIVNERTRTRRKTRRSAEVCSLGIKVCGHFFASSWSS